MRIKTFTTAELAGTHPPRTRARAENTAHGAAVRSGVGRPCGKRRIFENAVRLGLLDAAGLSRLGSQPVRGPPLLLPWLPDGRLRPKACWRSCGALLFLFAQFTGSSGLLLRPVEAAAWVLIIPAVSAYLAMNYTGCSTFTSLSGVKAEMRRAVPLEIAATAAGLILWAVSRFFF